MSGEYAVSRKRKAHLIFRYRTRALVAAAALRSAGLPPRELRVLEMGAAEGQTLLELRHLLGGNGDFIGIELSEELLAAAPKMPGGVQLIAGDVTALPPSLPEASFNMVTALAVLEHLPDPLQAAREAFRMLRPGGVFVATAPNPNWDRISTSLGLLQGEFHESNLTLDSLARLAYEAGFRSVVTKRFMFAPVGFLPYLRIPVNPRLALSIDAVVSRLRIADFLFVNQAVIAQRP